MYLIKQILNIYRKSTEVYDISTPVKNEIENCFFTYFKIIYIHILL